MKCLNCGNKIKPGFTKCPDCGFDNKMPDEFELPALKKEEVIEITDDDVNLTDNYYEIELKEKEEDEEFDSFEGIDNNILEEKTIMMPVVEEESTLEDDINKQIEDLNNIFDKKEEPEKEDNDGVLIDETEETKEPKSKNNIVEFNSSASIASRKNIFLVTGICSFIVMVIVLSILFIGKDNQPVAVKKLDYMESLTIALEKYYDSSDIDDIIYVLEDIKDDNDKVQKVQEKVKLTCDSWVLLYLNEELSDKKEFDEISVKYKELINGLHSYAIVKLDGKAIKALPDSAYEEVQKKIDDIYSDSTLFFEGYEYFNKKDYNKAYYIFGKIGKENSYYERALSCRANIIDKIIGLLEKDIERVEKNIDNATDEEKLQVYLQIEEIIFEYNNVYIDVNLNEDENYQKYLSLYTSRVAEYTNKVINNGN